MRVASYVARDNVRHQAPKAPLTLAWWGQLRQRAVRPLPLQIKSGARASHYAAKWFQQFITLYCAVFLASRQSWPDWRKLVDCGPGKKNDR